MRRSAQLLQALLQVFREEAVHQKAVAEIPRANHVVRIFVKRHLRNCGVADKLVDADCERIALSNHLRCRSAPECLPAIPARPHPARRTSWCSSGSAIPYWLSEQSCLGRRCPCPERQLGLIMIRGHLFQLCQDLRDDCRLLDAGNHLELPTKDALEALRQGHRDVARSDRLSASLA